MSKFIVITSINNPTEAVDLFSRMSDYNLIVVGDKKTPVNWRHDNVIFLSLKEQLINWVEFGKALPYNHYCRKMLGYLEAIKRGANCIIDTDDDNIPKKDWSFPQFEGRFDSITENQGFINIYQLYTNDSVWPRGFPLRLIKTNFKLQSKIERNDLKVGVWQGLADLDPDVDAVYRLTNNKVCHFNKRPPVVLKKGTITPFNTQNTIIRKELFPLLYLPTSVEFRFTDILRGLIAQPIMWQSNYHLGYVHATVNQERNAHDFFEDFISEIPMYQQCEKVIELTQKALDPNKDITGNLVATYELLYASNIVKKEELQLLDIWLEQLKKYS